MRTAIEGRRIQVPLPPAATIQATLWAHAKRDWLACVKDFGKKTEDGQGNHKI
jgi:hypothetical protein